MRVIGDMFRFRVVGNLTNRPTPECAFVYSIFVCRLVGLEARPIAYPLLCGYCRWNSLWPSVAGNIMETLRLFDENNFVGSDL